MIAARSAPRQRPAAAQQHQEPRHDLKGVRPGTHDSKARRAVGPRVDRQADQTRHARSRLRVDQVGGVRTALAGVARVTESAHGALTRTVVATAPGRPLHPYRSVASCGYWRVTLVGNPRRGVAMSHYKANLRDIEFNLFEVFGARSPGTGPFAEMDPRRPRRLSRRSSACRSALAESYLSSDRNPRSTTRSPARCRCPRTSRSPSVRSWTPSGGVWTCPSTWSAVHPRHCAGPPPRCSSLQPGAFLYMSGPASPRSSTASETRTRSAGSAHGRQGVGSHDGPHRARRRIRRRRGTHQGVRQRRRHLAYRGSQALHHLC